MTGRGCDVARMNARFAGTLSLLLAGAAFGTNEPDLSTPRRALRAFVESARAGNFATAAVVLDLGALPEASRALEGPRLSRQLMFVLQREMWPDWDQVSDEPDGSLATGASVEVLGTIKLGNARVPIRLARSRGTWRFGTGVVASIPELYAAYGPGWIGDRLPAILIELEFLNVQAWQWIGLLAALGLALFVALGLGAFARRIALRLARRTRFTWDDLLVEASSGPARMLLGLFTFAVAARSLQLAAPAQEVLDHALRIGAVAVFSWIGIRAIAFGAELLTRSVAAQGGDNAARSRLTQIMVMKRVADFVVILFGGALVLLQFDALRALGTSVLASAGVAGIVFGIAAQRSLATLLAGLQISLTQPLRVGDVVVIEGEWGTIEEITLTYVVVKVWDLRRLVVPITRILESPFQNWTRAGSDIVGTVFLHADYRLPVDLVRRELERFVASRSEWDRKVVGVQVTDASERTVQLRALVSSADAPKNWDLRCAVREHLLTFIQGLEGGAYLPRTRVEPFRLSALAATSGEDSAAPKPSRPTSSDLHGKL
jgi:small-conductance mechanosensitive channel